MEEGRAGEYENTMIEDHDTQHGDWGRDGQHDPGTRIRDSLRIGQLSAWRRMEGLGGVM